MRAKAKAKRTNKENVRLTMTWEVAESVLTALGDLPEFDPTDPAYWVLHDIISGTEKESSY